MVSEANGGTGNEVDVWKMDEEDFDRVWMHNGLPDVGKICSVFTEVVT